MRQLRSELQIDSAGPAMLEITDRTGRWLKDESAGTGLLTLFVRHTSASLVIQENADPDVQRDLLSALDRFAPRDPGLYRHTTEGPDDMPAHIRAMLTQTHLTIPVTDGRLDLGTWQGLFLIEHRDGRQRRRILLHYVGD